jgi:molybdopterin converting factor small subunit
MDSTVHVQVKLFGHLRPFSPQPILELELAPGSTVSDLIQFLVQLLGDDFRQSLLDREGNLHGGIEVVLNEEHLPARKVASILLPDACELIFMPMIEGGCSQILRSKADIWTGCPIYEPPSGQNIILRV